MKYLTLLTLTTALWSCSKNNDSKPKYDPAPTITNINFSTAATGSVIHPQFTVTLNIPDSLLVKQFLLFNKTISIPGDPYNPSNLPMVILNPKSGTYTLMDTYNISPFHPGKNTYTSAFIMSDNSIIYNSEFSYN